MNEKQFPVLFRKGLNDLDSIEKSNERELRAGSEVDHFPVDLR